MTTTSSIPFPGLDLLLPEGAIDAMTPTEIGVAYRVLRVAWSRAGQVPADLPTLIALARLSEADAVHVQSLFTLAGQPGADGRSIRFPILVEELERTRRSSSRRSAAGRANAQARWGSPPPRGPEPGGGLRLAGVGPPADANGNANGNAIGIANGIGGVSALSESSSGARRSSELSANPSAPESAKAVQSRGGRAPGARAEVPAPWALDLSKLSPEQAAVERARRSAVHAQIHWARFPEATQDKEFLPSNVSEAITLAPWVTEELAAFAVWEARRTVAEFARRAEAFNPIGLVISITGTTRHSPGRPRQVSIFFHQEWEKRLEAQRRQAGVNAAINARFAADVRAKAGGGA